MAISPLSVQQIVAVIRQQMTDPIRTMSTSVPMSAPGVVRKGAGTRSQTTKVKQGGLSKMIGHRVNALQVTDPERGRKAFRIFLESVLINELGEDLINDPSFYQMVDDIQVQMESNPDIAKAMREATDQLLSGVDPLKNAPK
ncbi:hypothetical protein [Solimicrobium silvestre]|uniref:Uncharacterized protein n=1 Tax=Solimicrobium silvestre TaxID=2099400 RepID=A0A2S9H1Q9_9BURK|nr:hypothetical protein [Solimicrobium silvestre]PRC93924.1 hypothetical protein S2091_1533 [Solimicrobium silvestre]